MLPSTHVRPINLLSETARRAVVSMRSASERSPAPEALGKPASAGAAAAIASATVDAPLGRILGRGAAASGGKRAAGSASAG
eukprot:351697-Chlamydomonas_euryale.AAC.7